MDRIDSLIAESFQNGTLSDKEQLERTLLYYLIHGVGRAPEEATSRDWYYAMAFLIRGVLSERHIRVERALRKSNKKKVYYLSMEYLIGRSMANHLTNLGLCELVDEVLGDFGQTLAEIQACESDAALGNGGLGRLAACFLDSIATHGYPAFGYGLRYDYGMFHQHIKNGKQHEYPEHWLRFGNPWEFERVNVVYRVSFGGRVAHISTDNGEKIHDWVDTHDVLALAFNLPVSGYASHSAGHLRLWSARATSELNLHNFNEGDYMGAVGEKVTSESLTKVLYPNDNTRDGQILRLKQEYFFCSATIQDIVARHLRRHSTLDDLPEHAVIQLNDTHPTLAIPELMRLMIDQHGYDFIAAWEVVSKTFAYTNHTLLPEALEVWSVELLEELLPRHLDIIYKINEMFLEQVRERFPGDAGILRRMSLIDDGRRAVRMAHLALVASFRVNGVAELHSRLLRQTLFRDFERMTPGKIVNMTNGITPRRWLLTSNRPLSDLISAHIGQDWVRDLSLLSALEPLAEDADFRESFGKAKQKNKHRLAVLVWKQVGIEIDPGTMFDSQVKRIHEYKRQLLNLLHVISRYNRLRADPTLALQPRTMIFAGKAAPGYAAAKQIIRLINDVAQKVNADTTINDRLKVVFLPNYNVSGAEVIIPGSDLSEQISTAGMEASGTGNMKFALNGALTIGTLDGANVEIRDEVGADNIFIFGLTAEKVAELRAEGYDPWSFYHANEELRQVLDMISQGYFSPGDPDRYKGLVDSLLWGGDHYMLLADFEAYVACQAEVDRLYGDPQAWMKRAILNVARMGKFSSDRTIHAYAKDIWGVESIGQP